MNAPSTPVLRLRSASFGYDGKPVVTDVDLDVGRGEVVAVLGPNGSGKTTLVKGLLGLSEHLSGQVEVLGAPLSRLRDRTRIGYVPQRHTLVGAVSATVSEVVDTGLLATRPWWRPADRTERERVREAIEVAGLADRATFDVDTLSGGQQRRVLIARALVSRPEVLVMDEPTAGVDRASQDVLAGVLHRLADEGTTLVVVTHELAALRGIVDRIVEVDTGHLTFDGTPEGYAVHRAESARLAGRTRLS
ncbi:metal ABC transporter ATP-binding protein [Ornithinimicrobium avium]|uniref:Metal ABC transporter ATP-binding protein n=1 Tax=Ornithinimicrobium avium TaxID=2283195 RepID=A0A345NRZ9_9MICO|nr:metal ABC transporter ATP-binding protein [Ornithinimicrobium avium]AXH97807.1 metal ABC transporter ATP-binding protein [Ornithinimicrobium avium]